MNIGSCNYNPELKCQSYYLSNRNLRVSTETSALGFPPCAEDRCFFRRVCAHRLGARTQAPGRTGGAPRRLGAP